MRGEEPTQGMMLAFLDPEARLPRDRPIGAVKRYAGAALTQLSPEFDRLYAPIGRDSIPPERLSKTGLLMAPSFGSFDPRPRCSLSVQPHLQQPDHKDCFTPRLCQ